MNGLKLKSYPGQNNADCCTVILVYSDCHESDGAIKPEKPGYITCIFENTFDPQFHLWAITKYKVVKDFIKKLRVCGIYVIPTEDLITNDYLVQEAMPEYHELVHLKCQETDTAKENY